MPIVKIILIPITLDVKINTKKKNKNTFLFIYWYKSMIEKVFLINKFNNIDCYKCSHGLCEMESKTCLQIFSFLESRN